MVFSSSQATRLHTAPLVQDGTGSGNDREVHSSPPVVSNENSDFLAKAAPGEVPPFFLTKTETRMVKAPRFFACQNCFREQALVTSPLHPHPLHQSLDPPRFMST